MAGLLISIRRGISIEGALPNAQAGVSVAAMLTADGAEYGVDWSMTGTLPPGWEVVYNGTSARVGGVATTAGEYAVTFRVIDGRSYRASRTYIIRITEADALLATDGSLTAPRDILGPLATVGEAYVCQITPIGGVPPYSWTLVSGSLPPGLSFSTSTGKITGTPSAPNVSSTAHYTLSDSASHSISVALHPLALDMTIDSTAPPAGERGKPYSHQFAVLGGHDHRWSITSGTLPAGLTLQPSGEITGVPEVVTAGTTVTVKCDSAGGASDTQAFTIVVDAATITVDADLPSTLYVDERYTGTLTPSGGAGTYTAAVTSGALPDGFEILPPYFSRTEWLLNGKGTAANVGTHSFTIAFTDSFGNVGSAAFTLTIAAADLVLYPLGGMPSGKVGSTYFSYPVPVSGGERPITLSILSGALPPGLAMSNPDHSFPGQIFGTPTTAGTYTFTIEATDSQSPAGTDTTTATITVDP